MLGHDVAATLPRLRAQAESLMVDACVIDRPTGQATDPVTAAVTNTYSAPLYTGKCRVQAPGNLVAANPEAGERQSTVLSHEVQLPVDAVVYRVGDRVTITAAALDPALVGRVFTVTSPPIKSHGTKRRLVCAEEVA